MITCDDQEKHDQRASNNSEQQYSPVGCSVMHQHQSCMPYLIQNTHKHLHNDVS